MTRIIDRHFSLIWCPKVRQNSPNHLERFVWNRIKNELIKSSSFLRHPLGNPEIEEPDGRRREWNPDSGTFGSHMCKILRPPTLNLFYRHTGLKEGISKREVQSECFTVWEIFRAFYQGLQLPIYWEGPGDDKVDKTRYFIIIIIKIKRSYLLQKPEDAVTRLNQSPGQRVASILQKTRCKRSTVPIL